MLVKPLTPRVKGLHAAEASLLVSIELLNIPSLTTLLGDSEYQRDFSLHLLSPHPGLAFCLIPIPIRLT